MNHLIQFEHLIKFMLGGKAEIVIRNKFSDHHITYKIQQSKKKETLYNVFHNKQYLGSIDASWPTKIFWPSKDSSISSMKETKVFKDLSIFIFNNSKLPNAVEVYHTGRCSVCNRTLKDPEYIKIGIGKICLENN